MKIEIIQLNIANAHESLTGSSTEGNNGGLVAIEGIVERQISNGGIEIVIGQVGSFSGKKPVIFDKGSILQGKQIDNRLRMPTFSPTGAFTILTSSC